MDNLKDEKNEDILGLFQESYNPIGLHGMEVLILKRLFINKL